MMINKKIEEILRYYKINVPDGILYLLALYYKLDETIIPEELKTAMNITNIAVRKYDSEGRDYSIEWNIPLFGEQPSDDWVWVDDYRKLFKDVKPEAAGDKQGCLKKMKKFFAEHPSVRKEDVMQAAKKYVEPFASGAENPRYLQRADYFISKFITSNEGRTEQSRLLQYLEIIKEAPKSTMHMNQLKK